MVAEGEELVVVVGVGDSIDGPHEAWGGVIYWFVVKFTDEKITGYGLTDRSTDGPTDTPTYIVIVKHGRI